MADHKDILSAECHEPKFITSATTADHGKVLTPSASANGVAELVKLEVADLSDASSVATLTGTQTLTNKRIQSRVQLETYAASLTADIDTFDVLACDSLTGNVTIAAPTGTPTDGQLLRVRLTQDGTGTRTVTFNSVFSASTAADTTASTTSLWVFHYHAARAKWLEESATVGV